MINIKLDGFVKEPESHQQIDDDMGWAEWRALSLTNTENSQGIAEWFYLVACNEYFFKKTSQSNSNMAGYVIQSEFNENDLFDNAKELIGEGNFKDWDDFYTKMKEKFIYEE